MLQEKRLGRHKRIRKKIIGTGEVPRLAVFRSSQHIYAQVIDDTRGITLASSSDTSASQGTKKERALKVGEDLAKKALSKKISAVIFDRGGFKYHGRVAALAEGARKGGLRF